jgi:LysR family transcriptional regulator for bpeEF and oprC
MWETAIPSAAALVAMKAATTALFSTLDLLALAADPSRSRITNKLLRTELTVQDPEQFAWTGFQAMEVFTRVVEIGGFTKAAEALRLPKATVTTLVQGLEAHLGVKLLNRTTRRVTVTPDGAAYYERCVRILAEVAETESALSRTRSAVRGRLRVDVPATFGRRVLVPALPAFFERYPELELEVGCADRPVDLIGEGVDCVVRGGEQADSSLVARRIATLDLITCATPGYLERQGVPRHPDDLARHRCIRYFSAKTGKMYKWVYRRAGERIELDVDGPLALNDSEAYLEAGLAGLGVMKATRFAVNEWLTRGRLVRVLEDWTSDPLPVYVMYPQNRHLSAKVRVFADWVAELVSAPYLLPAEVGLSNPSVPSAARGSTTV